MLLCLVLISSLLFACFAHAWHYQAPHTRDYFYLGGRYVDDGRGDFLLAEQTYVEHLIPVHGVKKPYPLVLIHGQAQTGTVRPISYDPLLSTYTYSQHSLLLSRTG